jgi:DnaK suppressor protein
MRTDLDLDAARDRLRARQAELDAKLGRLSAAPERGAGISFGKRIGDGTIEAVSRLTDIGVGRGMETEAELVDRALAKLDEGSYGVCDGCGADIPAKRLEVKPESARCVSCAATPPSAARR